MDAVGRRARELQSRRLECSSVWEESPQDAFSERFDVVWKGRKLAGAAQRRTRNGLLIQGSIQPPEVGGKMQWQAAMCSIAGKEWGVEWRSFEMGSDVQIDALEAKYLSMEYNQRR